MQTPTSPLLRVSQEMGPHRLRFSPKPAMCKMLSNTNQKSGGANGLLGCAVREPPCEGKAGRLVVVCVAALMQEVGWDVKVLPLPLRAGLGREGLVLHA